MGWGGMGGEKNHHLGHPISSLDAHTVANDTIVGPIVSGRKSRSPLHNWHPPWVPLFLAMTLEGQKMPFTKADQLTFNT